MGVLRRIGYFFAIVIIIVGIIFLPLGIIAIILGIIMIYVLHKGGQVSNMQKSIEIKRIEEENQRLRLDQMKKDALENRDRDNRNE
jgi:K+-transporting ATPase A subunit